MEKKKYKQLTLEERIEIYRLRADGKSLRFIANKMDRNPGTISRELRRNSKPSRHDPAGTYKPDRAERRALRRRHQPRGFLLDQRPDLADIAKPIMTLTWPANCPFLRFRSSNRFDYSAVRFSK